jgi:hypothetical protein
MGIFNPTTDDSKATSHRSFSLAREPRLPGDVPEKLLSSDRDNSMGDSPTEVASRLRYQDAIYMRAMEDSIASVRFKRTRILFFGDVSPWGNCVAASLT